MVDDAAADERERILDKAKSWRDSGRLSEEDYSAVCAVVMVDERELTQEEIDFASTLEGVMTKLGYDYNDPNSVLAYKRSLEYDTIDALPAGPELDRMVLEAIGYKNMGGVAPDYWRHPTNDFTVHLREFNPSEDIGVAMQAYEFMHSWGWAMFFEDMRLNPTPRPEDRCWWYELNRWDNPEAVLEGVQFATHDWELDGGGATMQECICHALLKVAKLRVNG